MVRKYREYRKVWSAPRRPFEKERLDREMKYCGEYGLRCKREIWRFNLMLTKLRSAARTLLTLEESDPRRQLEGAAILRRCRRLGLLTEDKEKLDYVLALTVPDLLERRLQTIVFKRTLAKSIHHARCLILQRHISVNDKIVSVPSYLVRTDSEARIRYAKTSALAGGRPGRVLRKKNKAAKSGGAAAEEAADE